ncbi:hypothetical protein CF319_g5935 [Tilletia indica]|nr:hypothetical protein CF319_g5935 [Tilletia indica]
MPIPIDLFRTSSTSQLRHHLVVYKPRRGASRMTRDALVSLMLEAMIEEETASLERAARLPIADILDLDRFLPIVHRQMVQRHGNIATQYFQSRERRQVTYFANATVSAAPLLCVSEAIPDLEVPDPAGVPELLADQPWPQPVSSSVKQACVEAFIDHTDISPSATCACCGRRTFDQDLLFTKRHVSCERIPASEVDLSILQIVDPHLLARPAHHFQYGDDSLDGLALHPDGVHVDTDGTAIDLCGHCHSALTASPARLPALALANDNVRGVLPPELQDCTWLEERLCAKYLASAYVVRLYDLTAPGAVEERARVMKGHACSFPLNTVSTAKKLPWAVDDDASLISCIVIGPRKPRMQDLRNVFKVRREKVRSLLEYLKTHCRGYPEFELDKEALASLPEDDVPELLMRSVIYQANQDVASLFAKETAGLDVHPAMLDQLEGDDDTPRTFLEHHGLLDINGVSVPAHHRVASALANATGTERPDLVIRHGSAFVEDYNNPDLFPGMYPTLFPWGTGGFEIKRRTPLSFKHQAKYFLDLSEPAFRRHWSFIFVVANIKQRRAIHLGSRLMCQSRDYHRFANILRTVDPALVRRVSEHVSRGGSLGTLAGDELLIFSVLKKCELVSANVPGSKAVMNRARADIKAYVGRYGIFQLFLTLNPGPTHSPVFQIFFGDRSITLDARAPKLPSSKERSVRVADDPVAASDYFHFHISAIFQYLLGWNIREHRSSTEGGLFGRLAAYYLVKEHSMRGQLHCHCLIWLEGGLNPAVLRTRMRSDAEFKERYFAFFDDLLAHGYPPTNDNQQTEPPPTTRKPRQERPIRPSSATYEDDFREDLHLLAHEVQRHRCTFTCFKGGRESCRFLFPHDVVETSTFDEETNSISLRVQHPLINWHNPHLLVATRHNHDLKAVQSGKSGSAAASYITSYTTKSEETPANQISMINTVYNRMAELGADSTDARSVLSKCVMQFGRERQVHAQQASTYVRDLGDTDQSHKTTPMLSGQLSLVVQKMFGPTRDANPPLVEEDASMTESSFRPALASIRSIEEAVTPSSDDEDDDDNLEDCGFMPLSHKGLAHQVDDYVHRGATLANLSFYDFVEFVVLDTPPKKKRNRNHHDLSESHPNSATHIHRYTPKQSHGIPRSIGAGFPRSDGSDTHGDPYCAAMMGHFIPFSGSQPLKTGQETWEEAFARTEFPRAALRVMDNWAALAECEDARDADQLRRRRREARTALRVDADIAKLGEGQGNENVDVDMEALAANQSADSGETLRFTSTLEEGGWFQVAANPNVAEFAPLLPSPTFSRQLRQTWTKEQVILEAKAKADLATPTASSGVLADQLAFDDTRRTDTLEGSHMTMSSIAPSTQRLHWQDRAPHDLLRALVEERSLTPSQSLAFTIAGRRFFEALHGVSAPPLRLLMHGEAGTGKTVVVRLLRELMDRFGRGHEIKFMAPTGKAAFAIGGMTQHSAFGIEVHRRGLTTEERQLAQRENSGKRIRFLQSSFAHVRWLFFDEVSMTSCEVFGEIDQALRSATQKLDEPFGGINVIFAGDLCQLPPVGAAPLYTKASRASQSGDVRTKVELGRLSWLSVDEVVEFTEQMRMKDSDMAAALTRLRTRQCVDADTSLFNTNVLRPRNTADAVDVRGRADLIVLAATNRTVRALNERKAATQAATASRHLVVSHAQDDTDGPISAHTRTALLSYNGRGETRVGIGRLPLFIGMPVVYRGPNKSVPLGITNGSFGTVAGWAMAQDALGLTVPIGAIVKFDDTATWRLSELEPGCLPIYPTASTFTFSISEDATLVRRISRRQLPLQPGFAMTVHSAQGITCNTGVVVDLRRGGFPAYVAASRATRREDIFLIADVTTKQLNSPPLPLTLRFELKRLQALATATERANKHDDWRITPPVLATNGDLDEDRPTKRARI